MSASANRSAGAEPTSSSSGLSSAGPNRVAVVSSVLEELPSARLVQRLGEQLVEEVDLDALVPQLLHEGVVLLPRALGPHHVVEEQVVDVARRQPRQLQTGTVHDDLLQDADLGVNVECHLPTFSLIRRRCSIRRHR